MMAITTNNLAGMQTAPSHTLTQPTKPILDVSIRKVNNGFIVTTFNDSSGFKRHSGEHVVPEFDYVKLYDLIKSLLQD